MGPERDVAAFDERAARYESGWRGRLHHEIADRTAAIGLEFRESPDRILDVGCGTGYLLRRLGALLPAAVQLVGIDPAPSMIEVARAESADERLSFSVGVAEHLPFLDQTFDLVVSTTSFDHWSDQQSGLSECARVMTPGGGLVLTDQFSGWLVPTLLVGRRGKARTKKRATHLLTQAGLSSPDWHDLYAVIIRTVTTVK
ncbi:MAG TPA: class I SAM-dependent methyltransferase [Candidatus Acidoferrales bacterium]|nr:class I SAM-dependent methyltransferase [Candidatus Acidoferrales bacterium]